LDKVLSLTALLLAAAGSYFLVLLVSGVKIRQLLTSPR